MPHAILIVDDEPPARARLRDLLADEADLRVAGECGDGDEAVRLLAAGGIDLVFLDVQMPGRDGFEVLRAVGPEKMPAVVFVTAYDEYALAAFDVHALDYLLKPFDRARFARCLERAREALLRRSEAGLEERLRALLGEAERGEGRIALKSRGKLVVVDPAEVRYIEAAGNYLRLYADGVEHLVRETLKELEHRLRARGFLRVHRSLLVNGARVRELAPEENGVFAIVLDDGTRLTSGRQYRETLQGLLRS